MDALVVDQTGVAVSPSQSQAQGDARFIIRKKVKPGGYLGWHQSEEDPMTNLARKTRQSSNYYFVCTEVGSRVERIFLVPEGTFNMERAGNVLSGAQMREFREVSEIEEPSLPPSFEFRRREEPSANP